MAGNVVNCCNSSENERRWLKQLDILLLVSSHHLPLFLYSFLSLPPKSVLCLSSFNQTIPYLLILLTLSYFQLSTHSLAFAFLLALISYTKWVTEYMLKSSCILFILLLSSMSSFDLLYLPVYLFLISYQELTSHINF